MSMIGNYLAVTEDEISSIRENPEMLMDFIYEAKGDEVVDIDKAWHAIHFTLNGSEWDGVHPYINVVLGGDPISDEDIGYGPARFLEPSLVKEVSEALSKIDESEFRLKFDPAKLSEHKIYPEIWDEGYEALDYVAGYYSDVCGVFKRAAGNDMGLIIFLN